MVGRPQKIRKIAGAPLVEGFVPKGHRGRQCRRGTKCRKQQEMILLLFEEYESIRLLDYVGLNQTEAAEQMNVSRPTLTRIYQRARQKVAKAFIEGCVLRFEGGKVNYKTEWYQCIDCQSIFNISDKRQEMDEKLICPLCSGSEIVVYHEADSLMADE
ncbi:MAG: DUF134 domain-containing protein [Bacteroidaceae bacterium]